MALQVAVGASLDEFERGMDRVGQLADKTVADVEKRFADSNPSIAQAVERTAPDAAAAGSKIGLIIGGAIFAAAAGIVTQLGSTINALANLGDKSEDLRLPVNLLQALSVAAGEARVSGTQLNAVLDQFTKVSKQADEEGNKFYTALENIGGSFSKQFQNAGTQADRLDVLRRAFLSTTDEVKRAQLAQEAFGTDSERVIRLITDGGSAFETYIQHVRNLGLQIDESFVRQAQEAKSQLSTLSRVVTDEFSSSMAGLIPVFVKLLPYLERLGGVVRDMLAAFTLANNEKPVATLQTELGTLENELQRLQELRDRLSSNKPSEADSLRDQLRDLLGIGPINTGDLDQRIKEVQDRIGVVKGLVDDAKRLKITVTGNQDAFKPRPDLIKPDTFFDTEENRINRHIALMDADTAAVGKTGAEHERLRTELVLLEAAQRDNDDVTTEQIDKYAKLRATMDSQQALTAAGIKLTDDQAESFRKLGDRILTVGNQSEAAKKSFQGVNDALRFGGNAVVDVLDRATQKGVKFGDVMADVLRSVSRELLRAAITGEGAFAKILGLSSNVPGGVGGLAGLLGGTSGTTANASASSPIITAADLPANFTAGFASGTNYAPGGMALVGENGPELVNLPRGSQVIPNDVARQLGGGPSIAINNVNDFRGVDPSMRDYIDRQLNRRDAALRQQIVPAIVDARRRSVRV